MKADKLIIKDPFLDRRTKLLPCQKEMVHYWYEEGLTVAAISQMFKVNRRTIEFILFPDRLQKMRERSKEKGGHRPYYDTETNRIRRQEERDYKRSILKNNSS